jgi:predicted nucleic acid-binding protein
VARLIKRLGEHNLIGVDTALFIYHLESNLRYQALAQEVLVGIENGRWRGVTSVITLMELTVRPWQQERAAVAREYEILLINFPNLSLVDVTRSIARRAAQLRASYGLRPADALHLASAIQEGATAFVTNDRGLVRLSQHLDIVLLDDFVQEEERDE